MPPSRRRATKRFSFDFSRFPNFYKISSRVRELVRKKRAEYNEVSLKLQRLFLTAHNDAPPPSYNHLTSSRTHTSTTKDASLDSKTSVSSSCSPPEEAPHPQSLEDVKPPLSEDQRKARLSEVSQLLKAKKRVRLKLFESILSVERFSKFLSLQRSIHEAEDRSLEEQRKHVKYLIEQEEDVLSLHSALMKKLGVVTLEGGDSRLSAGVGGSDDKKLFSPLSAASGKELGEKTEGNRDFSFGEGGEGAFNPPDAAACGTTQSKNYEEEVDEMCRSQANGVDALLEKRRSQEESTRLDDFAKVLVEDEFIPHIGGVGGQVKAAVREKKGDEGTVKAAIYSSCSVMQCELETESFESHEGSQDGGGGQTVLVESKMVGLGVDRSVEGGEEVEEPFDVARRAPLKEMLDSHALEMLHPSPNEMLDAHSPPLSASSHSSPSLQLYDEKFASMRDAPSSNFGGSFSKLLSSLPPTTVDDQHHVKTTAMRLHPLSGGGKGLSRGIIRQQVSGRTQTPSRNAPPPSNSSKNIGNAATPKLQRQKQHIHTHQLETQSNMCVPTSTAYSSSSVISDAQPKAIGSLVEPLAHYPGIQLVSSTLKHTEERNDFTPTPPLPPRKRANPIRASYKRGVASKRQVVEKPAEESLMGYELGGVGMKQDKKDEVVRGVCTPSYDQSEARTETACRSKLLNKSHYLEEKPPDDASSTLQRASFNKASLSGDESDEVDAIAAASLRTKDVSNSLPQHTPASLLNSRVLPGDGGSNHEPPAASLESKATLEERSEVVDEDDAVSSQKSSHTKQEEERECLQIAASNTSQQCDDKPIKELESSREESIDINAKNHVFSASSMTSNDVSISSPNSPRIEPHGAEKQHPSVELKPAQEEDMFALAAESRFLGVDEEITQPLRSHGKSCVNLLPSSMLSQASEVSLKFEDSSGFAEPSSFLSSFGATSNISPSAESSSLCYEATPSSSYVEASPLSCAKASPSSGVKHELTSLKVDEEPPQHTRATDMGALSYPPPPVFSEDDNMKRNSSIDSTMNLLTEGNTMTESSGKLLNVSAKVAVQTLSSKRAHTKPEEASCGAVPREDDEDAALVMNESEDVTDFAESKRLEEVSVGQTSNQEVEGLLKVSDVKEPQAEPHHMMLPLRHPNESSSEKRDPHLQIRKHTLTRNPTLIHTHNPTHTLTHDPAHRHPHNSTYTRIHRHNICRDDSSSNFVVKESAFSSVCAYSGEESTLPEDFDSSSASSSESKKKEILCISSQPSSRNMLSSASSTSAVTSAHTVSGGMGESYHTDPTSSPLTFFAQPSLLSSTSFFAASISSFSNFAVPPPPFAQPPPPLPPPPPPSPPPPPHTSPSHSVPSMYPPTPHFTKNP